MSASLRKKIIAKSASHTVGPRIAAGAARAPLHRVTNGLPLPQAGVGRCDTIHRRWLPFSGRSDRDDDCLQYHRLHHICGDAGLPDDHFTHVGQLPPRLQSPGARAHPGEQDAVPFVLVARSLQHWNLARTSPGPAPSPPL